MHVARLRVENFRCFVDSTVEFRAGVTVVIGENNAGKTALLDALSLVFARGVRWRPGVEDFSKPTLGVEGPPPRIRVTVTLVGEASDSELDHALVATWLTKLGDPWEAQLTYEFGLPEEHHEEFKRETNGIAAFEAREGGVRRLLPKYVARTWGGDPKALRRADPLMLEKIGFRLLDALRDVEHEMFHGRHPLLKRVLQGVLDRGDHDADLLHSKRAAFRVGALALMGSLVARLSQGAMFALVAQTGARDGGEPKIGGTLSETDALALFTLLLAKHGFEIPASHNGLGFNNLLYIALILAELELAGEEDVQGAENALVFPLLVIEEPEAHLHPSMQYKLLRYLRNRVDVDGASRQVIVTSHSTHITAATNLDQLVCLSVADHGGVRVSYPGRAFPDTKEGRASKAYVERFLDATKSSMLFAKAVIFVEGLAEALIVPPLAERCGTSIEDRHVAVVPVGGKTVKHFLPLFGCVAPATLAPHALQRRVAVIVDADPARKEKDTKGARWHGCPVEELGLDPARFDYLAQSTTVDDLLAAAADTQGQHVLVRVAKETFEYDLASENVGHPHLETVAQEVLEKKRFARAYLESVEDRKGEAALALSVLLKLPLDPALPSFEVPAYLREAIRWACLGEIPQPGP